MGQYGNGKIKIGQKYAQCYDFTAGEQIPTTPSSNQSPPRGSNLLYANLN
jgi:hypothetical protein